MKNSCLIRFALAIAAGLVGLDALFAAEPATTAAPAFRKVVLETNCWNPMELAVLPDGRLLFIERFGAVKLWKPDTKSTVQAAHLNVHGSVNAMNARQEDKGSWEAGLLGLTLDPNFADNSWVWLYYSPKDGKGNQVSRFTLRGDTLDLSSEKVVLQVAVQREVCCHEAGSLAFDGAGNLFLSTGDNTNPFASDGYNPTDYRTNRYPWDAARSAGTPTPLGASATQLYRIFVQAGNGGKDYAAIIKMLSPKS